MIEVERYAQNIIISGILRIQSMNNLLSHRGMIDVS